MLIFLSVVGDYLNDDNFICSLGRLLIGLPFHLNTLFQFQFAIKFAGREVVYLKGLCALNYSPVTIFYA